MSKSYGVKNIMISGVLPRRHTVTLQGPEQEQCHENGFSYIDNTNIGKKVVNYYVIVIVGIKQLVLGGCEIEMSKLRYLLFGY